MIHYDYIMADSTRPQITSEHHERYTQIMGTPLKSASQPVAQNSNTSQKLKGLGNKMFIFTGKKKIILEGTQRQVESVKTVSPAPAKSPTPETLPTGRQAKEEVKHKTEPQGKKPESVSSVKHKKPIPMPIRVIAVLVFFSAYTFIWLTIFGFLSF